MKSSKAKFFQSRDLATLKVGSEEKEFHVHTDLLCECSKFFKSALCSGFQESEQRLIKLPDSDLWVVGTFVNWMYTGVIAWPDNIGAGRLGLTSPKAEDGGSECDQRNTHNHEIGTDHVPDSDYKPWNQEEYAQLYCFCDKYDVAYLGNAVSVRLYQLVKRSRMGVAISALTYATANLPESSPMLTLMWWTIALDGLTGTYGDHWTHGLDGDTAKTINW